MRNIELARLQITKHGIDRYPTVGSQFTKLVEEVGELAKEVNMRPVFIDNKIIKEMVDVALALYNLSDKLGIDLDQAIEDLVNQDTRKFT